MSEDAQRGRSSSVATWLLRDFVLLAGIALFVSTLHRWSSVSAATSTTLLVWTGGFIAAYATCYLVHEWGHYLGAIVMGARPPRHRWTSALLADFDPTRHSRAQFLGLSYGGLAAYLAVTISFLVVGWNSADPAMQSLALGGAAFAVQSVWVDSGVIVPVHRGVAPLTALRDGVTGPVILRKTSIAWLLLGLVIATTRS